MMWMLPCIENDNTTGVMSKNRAALVLLEELNKGMESIKQEGGLTLEDAFEGLTE